MTGTTFPARGSRPRPGEWLDEGRLAVGDVVFDVIVDPDRYMAEQSTPRHFVVAKRPDMVELLTDVVEELEPRRIVELGIFKGGSAALLASLAAPEMLTAIELSADPVSALEGFLDEQGLRELRSPATTGSTRAIVTRSKPSSALTTAANRWTWSWTTPPICSRRPRSSFEVLFPRLRPGGLFLIEDWAWAHYPEPVWQRGGGIFHDRPALTNLIVELMMIVGSRSDLIADITVVRDIALIRRGSLRRRRTAAPPGALLQPWSAVPPDPVTHRQTERAATVALYLPQFHPIPENDGWYLPGFSEWHNVVRAQPHFAGHEQPHLPRDLGFYDLRVPEVLEQQARLARQHGIDAFCLHHYWFEGHRPLRLIVDRILASGRPRLPVLPLLGQRELEPALGRRRRRSPAAPALQRRGRR